MKYRKIILFPVFILSTLTVLLFFNNCALESNASDPNTQQNASSSDPTNNPLNQNFCQNPDTKETMNSGQIYSYYTKQTGSNSIECELSRTVSVCQNNGLLLPDPTLSNRYISCTSLSSPPPPSPTPPPPTPPQNSQINLGLDACVAGKGKDYQVGPNPGQLPNLELVPWESLSAGDTVRIFYSNTSYKGKFILSGQGTALAPIRICGVKSTSGQRPIIDGDQAKSRATAGMGTSASQAKGLILIKTGSNKSTVPSYIQIDGLVLKSTHSNYSFTDQAGVLQKYADFSACIWFENGNNITIADNELTDCSQGIFSVSVDGSASTLTKNLRIAGNIFTNNGVANDSLKHVTYIQSYNVTYEYNIFKAMRTGAPGNAIKDRSVGVIVRYNRFESGTRHLDLVDAEEHKLTAQADPNYRNTYVYGNQFIKFSREIVHYGGDHPGSEPYFRKGTLYFYHNSITASGNVKLFQITTTDEKVEAFNNVIFYSTGTATWRADDSTSTGILPTGGQLNLGKNWINSNWRDSDITLSKSLTGRENLITGTATPFDSNFVPLLSSPILNQATTLPVAVSNYPVSFQLNTLFRAELRSTSTTPDLGALERP